MKTVPCMEKSWNLKKKLNNHGIIMDFCEIIDETTRSQKTSCQTHKLVCLTARFLATGGFKF